MDGSVDDCSMSISTGCTDNVTRLQTGVSVTADKLQQDIEKLKKQLSLKERLLVQIRKKYKTALRKIRKISNQRVKFEGAMGQFLNSDQQKSLCKVNNKGCKWSPSTIKNALQLHFACGPTGYRVLLSQKYPLPSLRTLRRSIQFVKFESGILTEVFHFLAIKVKDMNVQERQCCLTLDEMSITASVELDNRNGNFIGEVTLPGHTGPATHSLVFMIGGISTRWKQTVAYYFASNSTDGTVFADIVTEIIERCHLIGINVVAVTSDMGSANRAMWKKLGIVGGKRTVTVNSFTHPCNPQAKVVVLADVPHVIKNVRNHLVNGQSIFLPQSVVQQFNLPSNEVSIKPLRQLVEYQQDRDLKPAPNLTAKHLDPAHFDKMKVSHALNLFSHSVSASLRLMVETQNWDSSVLTTCWFLELMNKWFDLMSSRHPVLALSKFDVEKYECAISFLHVVIDVFDNLAIGQKATWKPVQTGVILSTLSVLQLQERLLNYDNFKFLLTARLTQDCLENLFSCIRSKNAVPTPLEFKNTLRLLTVSQYLKGAESGSYELDEGNFVADFVSLQPRVEVEDRVSEDLVLSCQALLNYDALPAVELDPTEMCCLYYLGGYVLSRVEKNDATCQSCIAAVSSSDFVQEFDSSITRLLTLKEYRPGCLKPCNQTAFNLILSAEITFRQLESSFLSTSNNLREQLFNEISVKTAEIDLPNCHSIKQKILRRFIGARLQFFAKKQRLIIKGKVSKKCHGMSSKSMQMRKSVSKIK